MEIDLVFVDFIESLVLDVQSGKKYTSGDISLYRRSGIRARKRPGDEFEMETQLSLSLFFLPLA